MKCQNCKKDVAIIIYRHKAMKGLCGTCEEELEVEMVADKLEDWMLRQEIIFDMPDILDLPPPLGYNFIIDEYISDEEEAKATVDRAYKYYGKRS